MVAEGEIAGDYLEELLDLLDFDGDIDLDVEGDRAIVSIDGGERPDQARRPQGRGARRAPGADPAGRAPEDRRAQPADAGHRAAGVGGRRDELAALGDKVARRVLESGEREELSPMTPFERKIVHDAVAAVDGVRSESEGAEPSRRVVVLAGLTGRVTSM